MYNPYTNNQRIINHPIAPAITENKAKQNISYETDTSEIEAFETAKRLAYKGAIDGKPAAVLSAYLNLEKKGFHKAYKYFLDLYGYYKTKQKNPDLILDDKEGYYIDNQTGLGYSMPSNPNKTRYTQVLNKPMIDAGYRIEFKEIPSEIRDSNNKIIGVHDEYTQQTRIATPFEKLTNKKRDYIFTNPEYNLESSYDRIKRTELFRKEHPITYGLIQNQKDLDSYYVEQNKYLKDKKYLKATTNWGYKILPSEAFKIAGSTISFVDYDDELAKGTNKYFNKINDYNYSKLNERIFESLF